MINRFGLYVIAINQLSTEKYIEITKLLRNNTKYSINSKYAPQIINVLWEHKGILYLPRQFGRKYIGPENQSLVTIGNAIDPKKLSRNMGITLWPHQIDAVNTILRDYSGGSNGGIAKIACGKGKTFMALELVAKIGYKTLIIVDKTTLAEDWLREAKIYLPDITVGIKCEQKDADIVIMVINSVYLGKFKPENYLSYGLVIIDEVHNIIGQKVLNAFRYISRRYILGLSGTPTRADHLEYMLEWYIGPIIYSGTVEYTGAIPIVHLYRYICNNSSLARVICRKDGSVDATSTFKNTMINDIERRHFLVKIIINYQKQFNQLLVIGLYRDQLEGLMMELGDNGLCFEDIGIYYGGLGRKENEAVRARKVILGMRKMCAESLNIPELRCIILASSYKPANNGENTEKFEQQLHRIMRKNHTESPIIVDISDNFGFFIKHSQLRREYYQNNNFLIKKYVIE